MRSNCESYKVVMEREEFHNFLLTIVQKLE